MPRDMPERASRAIEAVLGWSGRPNPVDIYAALREALAEEAADPQPPRERDVRPETWPKTPTPR